MTPNSALERAVNHRDAQRLCERVSCVAGQLGR
jgi:hypothetical protein